MKYVVRLKSEVCVMWITSAVYPLTVPVGLRMSWPPRILSNSLTMA